MREKLQLIMKHLRQGSLQKMWKQTIWIYQYGRRYWKSMILYTLLGVMGSCVSLASSLISKDLVDIITGHQTGRLMNIVEIPQEDYSQDHAVKLFEKQHKKRYRSHNEGSELYLSQWNGSFCPCFYGSLST